MKRTVQPAAMDLHFSGPFVLVEYSSGERAKIGINGEPFTYADAELKNIVI
jgi:hypothetical protein